MATQAAGCSEELRKEDYEEKVYEDGQVHSEFYVRTKLLDCYNNTLEVRHTCRSRAPAPSLSSSNTSHYFSARPSPRLHVKNSSVLPLALARARAPASLSLLFGRDFCLLPLGLLALGDRRSKASTFKSCVCTARLGSAALLSSCCTCVVHTDVQGIGCGGPAEGIQ